jgi:hypothetical protein
MMRAEPDRRPKARIRLLVLPITLAFLAACSSPPTSHHAAGGRHRTTETQTVVFSGTGGGTSTSPSITYATLQQGGARRGESGIIKNVPLPWSKTIVETVSPDVTTGLWPYYYLDVHNGLGGLTYVTCSISVDGQVVSTDKAVGPNAIASCGAPSHISAPVQQSLGATTS